MQNIRKKNRSRILAGLLCIALLIGTMPFNAINAHAADGKITIRVGERIDYSSHFTHYFYAGFGFGKVSLLRIWRAGIFGVYG